MNEGTIHIIGAGLAGLSAATSLAEAGRRVIVYEAAGQAGGRCRSYYDDGFGATLDNGNHLLLSGNDGALSYLKRIGSNDAFKTAREPVFNFVDAKTTKRWTLHLSKGLLPFWLLSKNRRVPDTSATDYLAVLPLLHAKPEQTVLPLLNEKGMLYQRLWHPLLLSALNTHPQEASARLAGAIISDTLLKGGKACIPLVADGLSSTFIDPALHYLAERGMNVQFNRRLRFIASEAGRTVRLEFTTGEPVAVAASDSVICAVPSWNIASLLPYIQVPDVHRAILNAHFRIAPPASFPVIMGVVNATTEWIFAFQGRISVTVSAADALMQEEREVLAGRIWGEISAITGLAKALPPWQIVKEKRATFAATPDQDAKRPGTLTSINNLYLAGDWVQTGLPATIEGAIRSGTYAAEHVIRKAA